MKVDMRGISEDSSICRVGLLGIAMRGDVVNAMKEKTADIDIYSCYLY